MAIAIDKKSRLAIILPEDRGQPKDKQTIFYMRPLTVGRMRLFMETLSDKGEDKSIEEIIKLLGSYLIGWANFCTSDGEEIKFKLNENGGCSDENWEHMTVSQTIELMNAFLEANRLGEAQLKNLNSGHSSFVAQ